MIIMKKILFLTIFAIINIFLLCIKTLACIKLETRAFIQIGKHHKLVDECKGIQKEIEKKQKTIDKIGQVKDQAYWELLHKQCKNDSKWEIKDNHECHVIDKQEFYVVQVGEYI
jgi:hypothetical protein